MKKILILGALMSGAAMAGDLSVKDCLVQEVIPGKHMTGAFFTLENSGKDTVKLTAATADKITSKVELHEMVHKDGKMEMSQIQSYDVTPGEHHFKKGGYHIMFFGLKKPLQEGDKFDLNLKFKNAKPQKITVTVKPMQAGAMPAHDHGAGEAKHAH